MVSVCLCASVDVRVYISLFSVCVCVCVRACVCVFNSNDNFSRTVTGIPSSPLTDIMHGAFHWPDAVLHHIRGIISMCTFM